MNEQHQNSTGWHDTVAFGGNTLLSILTRRICLGTWKSNGLLEVFQQFKRLIQWLEEAFQLSNRMR